MKYIFLLFLSFLSLEIISSHEIIEQYGKKKTENKYIFLDISGFNSDSKIYISVTTIFAAPLDKKLYYNFYENIDDIIFFSAPFSVESSSSSSVAGLGTYEETYNYKITKTDANAKYLYLEYNFEPPVTVENTENDKTTVLIIITVICSVIAIAIFIVIVVCCCCRRNKRAAYVAAYPNSVGYGVSPYVGQPIVPVVQPVMQPVLNVQPYGTGIQPNSNYNYNPNNLIKQDSTSSRGSDYRINQPQNYVKPV